MKNAGTVAEEDLIRFHSGALTGAEREAILRRIGGDPAAQRLLAEWARQDAALRTLAGQAEALPPAMQAALDAARTEDRAGRWPVPAPPLRLAAAVALLAIGAAGGFLAARTGVAGAPAGRFAEAALGAHAVYVTEVAHPVEVQASQSEHLAKWLSKRLGHPIAAPDLGNSGFRLVGGRLLPAETGGPAAFFMYEDASGRRVTLYAVPGATAGDSAFRLAERGATESFYWVDGTLSCAVTGDIPRDDLRALALAAYDQLI